MPEFAPVEEQLAVILRGAVQCLDEKDLRKYLAHSRETGKPLRVKLGLDPSRPDIHIGHTVVLRKLRQFQNLGHQAVLIIGDATAMVGDPSGKSKTRPVLNEEEVQAAAATYLDQVSAVLDVNRLEIQRNRSWFARMTFDDVMRLAARTTVARVLERDDFHKRFHSQAPISLHELFYPLMQAWDSVEVKADVELGGTDQTFNLLMGRKVQEDAGLKPQVCITTPLVPGLDGVEKMSKSLGNTIDVRALPDDMFGKTMSIADSQMKTWFTLLTDTPEPEIEILLDPTRTNPRNAKDRLAREIVASFHGTAAAQAASDEFVRRFRQHELPTEMPESGIAGQTLAVADVLVATGMCSSKGEARRLIQQGGVSIVDDGATVETARAVADVAHVETWKAGMVLKAGKRKFLRVV